MNMKLLCVSVLTVALGCAVASPRARASDSYDKGGALNVLSTLSRGAAVRQAPLKTRPKDWVKDLFEGKSGYLDNEEVDTG